MVEYFESLIKNTQINHFQIQNMHGIINGILYQNTSNYLQIAQVLFGHLYYEFKKVCDSVKFSW